MFTAVRASFFFIGALKEDVLFNFAAVDKIVDLLSFLCATFKGMLVVGVTFMIFVTILDEIFGGKRVVVGRIMDFEICGAVVVLTSPLVPLLKIVDFLIVTNLTVVLVVGFVIDFVVD